jgi:RHS repeat-associated protein
LGNVLSVISDKVIPHSNGTIVDYWQADILQSTDYSPFGVTLKNRTLCKNGVTDFTRFGFQNQEEDPETGLVNYKYRMHDPRLGRFFAIDPLAAKYPHNSPYAFSENIIINGKELEGLEVYFFMLDYTDNTKTQLRVVLSDVIDAKIYTIFGAVNMNQGVINLIMGSDGEWHEIPEKYLNGSLDVFGSPEQMYDAINSFPIKPYAQEGLNYKNNVEALSPLFEGLSYIFGSLAFNFIPEVTIRPKYDYSTATSKLKKVKGVYEIKMKDGSVYVGESNNIGRRLKQHRKKFGENVESVQYREVKDGSKFDREVLEQRVLDDHRGQGTKTLNKKEIISSKSRKDRAKKSEQFTREL